MKRSEKTFYLLGNQEDDVDVQIIFDEALLHVQRSPFSMRQT